MQTQIYKCIVTNVFWKTPYLSINRLLWGVGWTMGGMCQITRFCVIWHLCIILEWQKKWSMKMWVINSTMDLLWESKETSGVRFGASSTDHKLINLIVNGLSGHESSNPGESLPISQWRNRTPDPYSKNQELPLISSGFEAPHPHTLMYMGTQPSNAHTWTHIHRYVCAGTHMYVHVHMQARYMCAHVGSKTCTQICTYTHLHMNIHPCCGSRTQPWTHANAPRYMCACACRHACTYRYVCTHIYCTCRLKDKHRCAHTKTKQAHMHTDTCIYIEVHMQTHTNAHTFLFPTNLRLVTLGTLTLKNCS